MSAEGGVLITDEGHNRVRYLDADLRPGPAGPAGPVGAAGPPAANGAPGIAGPTGAPGAAPARLVVVLTASTLSVKRGKLLSVRFAATGPAAVTLVVLKGKTRIVSAKMLSKAGRNTLTVRVKTTGRYALVLTAIAGSQTSSDKAALAVKR